MGKKVDEKITIIKFLLGKGYNQAKIARKTKYPKQTVSRLVKKIKGQGANKKKKDKTKLPKKYFNKIIEMATNKTTRQMSGGAISNAINEELQNKKILNKKRKILSITKRQVNRILKKKLIQRKVRKTFYLNSDHKKEREKNIKISKLKKLEDRFYSFNYQKK